MRIVVEAFWDDEAGVWVATAVEDIGLATEAGTVEELERKLAAMVPDLLGTDAGPFDIELVMRRTTHVAAE
jgi:hypothetical protein